MLPTRFGRTVLLAAATLVGLITLPGCSTDTPGRINSYLGPAIEAAGASTSSTSMRVPLPQSVLTAGLLVVNDTAAPDSAPPLSVSSSALMVDLVRESLEHELPIHVVKVLPTPEILAKEHPINVLELSRRHEVDHLVLAIHSSREHETPTYLGQGFMMTQMPGVTVVNNAMVEMALLDVKNERVLIQAHGQGSETMEELDTPIGTNQPSKEEARDILRINAAKNALDRTMMEFNLGFAEAYQDQ